MSIACVICAVSFDDGSICITKSKSPVPKGWFDVLDSVVDEILKNYHDEYHLTVLERLKQHLDERIKVVREAKA